MKAYKVVAVRAGGWEQHIITTPSSTVAKLKTSQTASILKDADVKILGVDVSDFPDQPIRFSGGVSPVWIRRKVHSAKREQHGRIVAKTIVKGIEYDIEFCDQHWEAR